MHQERPYIKFIITVKAGSSTKNYMVSVPPSVPAPQRKGTALLDFISMFSSTNYETIFIKSIEVEPLVGERGTIIAETF